MFRQQLRSRQILKLDRDWCFHPGDIVREVPNKHLSAYMANKAGWAGGAAKPSFDDTDWRVVNLPHDWSVEGKFDPSNHVDSGFLPRGVGWYRRHFRLEEADRDKCLAIQFDGVATHCTVWVNGHCLHRNFCGYTPFMIGISDVANFGDDLNCVAVRVDATYMEGWWYEGAGIYRHVWLIKTSPVHVVQYGVYINPVKISPTTWDTRIQTTIQNSSNSDEICRLVSMLYDADGRLAGSAESDVKLCGYQTVTIDQRIEIERPRLWSVDEPNLYQLVTELHSAGGLIDDCITTFGYRTIRFDSQEGFFLNDQPIRLKGTCNHQDHAGLGVALPDSIHEFRIRRLKQMGTNAYRCAHNPPAPELLDACDRLGMLVMDENRNFGSSPQHLEQLAAMVLRDRNHPSVILWSICNEEPLQGSETGQRIAQSMVQAVKRLDDSRPVTAAISGGLLNEKGIAHAVDVVGINYQLSSYDAFHARYPDKPIVASETHSALSTRGIYQTDPGRFVFSCYPTEKAPWGATAPETWRQIVSRKFIAGLFAWTGFDYRGEPSPNHWPCVSSYFGLLDTCGFEKDTFHLHRAYFTDKPFVHLMPHWNWPGREGQPIRVMALTNCHQVELFLNGQSLGRKDVDPIDMVDWQVPYQPGELAAEAYRDGRVAARTSVQTTGQAVALGLEIHPAVVREKFPADGEFALPITAFAVDAEGRRVPTANDYVTFSVEGPGVILGVGNGDPTCHEPDKACGRSLFNGLAQVIIQTGDSPGRITLKASARGLKPAKLHIDTSPQDQSVRVPPARRRHFVKDWRMSPITAERPDPHQTIAEQDMNTWQQVDPASGPQPAWQTTGGYAIYRATFSPPKIIQAQGGRIVFHQIVGRAEIFLNGVTAASKHDYQAGKVELPLPAGLSSATLSVLIHSDKSPAGLTQRVELMT